MNLTDLLDARAVAQHFNISERRARALIANRHERHGIGTKVGQSWLVHRDDLGLLEPDEKYKRKDQPEQTRRKGNDELGQIL